MRVDKKNEKRRRKKLPEKSFSVFNSQPPITLNFCQEKQFSNFFELSRKMYLYHFKILETKYVGFFLNGDFLQ